MKEWMPALFIFKRIRLLRIDDDSSDNRNFLLDGSQLEQLKLLGDIHHLCERAKVPLQRIVEAHLRCGNNLRNAAETLCILDTDSFEKGVAQQRGVVLPALGATFWVSGLALFEACLYVFSDFISHFRVSRPPRRGGADRCCAGRRSLQKWRWSLRGGPAWGGFNAVAATTAFLRCNQRAAAAAKRIKYNV